VERERRSKEARGSEVEEDEEVDSRQLKVEREEGETEKRIEVVILRAWGAAMLRPYNCVAMDGFA
jgi:hypothetical protein